MDGGNLTREIVIPLLDANDPTLRQTAWSILTSRPAWADGVTGLLGQWLAQTDLSEVRREMLRNALPAFAKNQTVQELISRRSSARRLHSLRGCSSWRPSPGCPWRNCPRRGPGALARSLKHADDRVARQAVATIRARRMQFWMKRYRDWSMTKSDPWICGSQLWERYRLA